MADLNAEELVCSTEVHDTVYLGVCRRDLQRSVVGGLQI